MKLFYPEEIKKLIQKWHQANKIWKGKYRNEQIPDDNNAETRWERRRGRKRQSIAQA